MKQIELTFFDLLAKNLVCKEHEALLPSSVEDWQLLYKIAKSQKLWAVVFEEVCSTSEYLSLPADLQMAWLQEAVSSSASQIIQANELSRICKILADENIKYTVLKGITCRRYYPNPNSRPSGDEDIIIDWRDYKKCDKLLLDNGYDCEDNYDFNDIENKREAHYIHKEGLLYLEVHFNAIGRENQRQERLNASFEDVFNHTVVMNYEEYQLTVLEPTYQIMHLLSHFYRHLYECGVGVRQMLDILMTLRAEYQNVNWNALKKFLDETRMNKIFATILNTGKKYFNMDLSFVPEMLWNEEIDPEPLLEDMIDGGIYGHGDDNKRKLAGNFTLDIDTNQSNIFKVLFPPKARLAGRYPILNRHPSLYLVLDVARWFEILKEYGKDKESRSVLKQRVKIGKERKSMLEKYTD